MLIAIPAYQVSCAVRIDTGRAWSVIEEITLWASARRPNTIGGFAEEARLPRQVVVAAIARLMRFRLVELELGDGGPRFRASPYGREIVEGGLLLPFFPRSERRWVGFVVDRATGEIFHGARVRASPLERLRNDADPDLREVLVENGAPSMTHEANFARLASITARGFEERLAYVDALTADVREVYVPIRVVDGVPRNVPETAGAAFRDVVAEVAARPGCGAAKVAVAYRGVEASPKRLDGGHACDFDHRDLVIGGPAQRERLVAIIAAAQTRVIVHSTFLSRDRFDALAGHVRAACTRGVRFDLLWGADVGDEPDDHNLAAAVSIAKAVREDPDMRGRFKVHAKSTGSHAKILLADDDQGAWIAAVGSCNWFSSPFQSNEATAVLRAPGIVADVAEVLQDMAGERGLSDPVASEMALLAADLRRRPRTQAGSARVSLVLGNRHAALMREASGQAQRRFLVGTHRLGSTARPGMVLPAEIAARRVGVEATLIYTRASGPVRNRDARAAENDARTVGVRLMRAVPSLHGKFLAWDENDAVVTSLNWGSATADDRTPQAEVGVHVHSAGIAEHVVREVSARYPGLFGSDVPGGERPRRRRRRRRNQRPAGVE
ncbi:phospholipase D-like domain-containing protein [Lichenibacterium ramalinae]|uniref:Phospholipase D n=1 Tax=Lichenibacterium ramalinae TaxID=2316527 RepID=A0A4Q2RE53_9HYPH|nr:phospholipase D-like domain-containing protein [Lichenibacterium ramalinae]RYB04328.1 phosphatidylserine synthase [Lichenibacterium ramalinae]